YVTNEHRVTAAGEISSAGEVFGYDQITRQYYQRYLLPVMHTETNFHEGPRGDEAVNWLWKEWANVLRVRNDGIPVVGFTWYSLTDQVDWDSALRENRGTVNALGLFDLDRKIRPVGEAFKKIVREWGDVLPTQRMSLREPRHRVRPAMRWRTSRSATFRRRPTSSPPSTWPSSVSGASTSSSTTPAR